MKFVREGWGRIKTFWNVAEQQQSYNQSTDLPNFVETDFNEQNQLQPTGILKVIPIHTPTDQIRICQV